MKMPRRLISASLAAGLALGLAACGSDTKAKGALEGDPIEAIAAPDGQSWADTVNVSEADGFVLGNPDAPIKLIEYGSLTCGACAMFSEQAKDSLKEKYINTGVVSFELRNQIHNGIDLVLARLVRCGAPEQFHPLSQEVWSNLQPIIERANANAAAMEAAQNLPEEQRFAGVAQAAGLLDFFAARGVSADQARTCLSDVPSVTAIGKRSAQQSEELGVTGTPTFFINGQNQGTLNWARLEPMLQAAGAR